MAISNRKRFTEWFVCNNAWVDFLFFFFPLKVSLEMFRHLFASILLFSLKNDFWEIVSSFLSSKRMRYCDRGQGRRKAAQVGCCYWFLCGDNFLSASDLSVTSHYDLCALSSTFLCVTAWGVAAFYVPPVLRECIEFSAVWLLLSANLIYPSGRISESNTEML